MTKDSTRKWLFTLLLGLIIFTFLFFTRIYWYSPWCAVTPTPCVVSQVNVFDRIVFQFNSIRADFWSNVIQNVIGFIVFITPWLLFSRKIALEETLYTASISFWNLACLEVVRALVQRPRPLVFQSILGDGANINSYTSFYSGHTSFVALATLSFYFIMKRRFKNISSLQKAILIFSYGLLTILTGTLRIIGGRHYPTDVIAAALIATLITIYFQRKVDTKC